MHGYVEKMELLRTRGNDGRGERPDEGFMDAFDPATDACEQDAEDVITDIRNIRGE
jgi:hypothetical protein